MQFEELQIGIQCINRSIEHTQHDKSFDYRGLELFGQRACLLISDVDQAVLDCAKINFKISADVI